MDCIKLTSYYYDPTLKSQEASLKAPEYPRSPSGTGSVRFNLTVSSDGVSCLNTISVDGIQVLQTPLMTSANRQYVPNTYTNPYLYFTMKPSDLDTEIVLRVYSLAQTVPAYEYITPISDPSITPYGLDGPHLYDTVDGGIALLQSHGGRGTIWADVGILASYSDENITALKQLIAEGWELGIHYTTGLSDKAMDAAIIIMDSQYAQITDIFGQAPTSWCSLRNLDNVTHAAYAYANLGMVWRNGYVGVHGQSNVGNLCDELWPWWANASAAGMVFPTFTH
jgi:hypothetical protein